MKNILVAYFSATGVTEAVAERLSQVVGGDLYRIEPQTPYTEADLDWTKKNSRSSVEMNDRASRPEITGTVEGMEKYDVIFVGFPIWWYVAPTIVNTFLERYDLKGKTVIPFATSGISGMGKTNERLMSSCAGAALKEGKRFVADVNEAELKTWAAPFIR